jgi:hypothetical protein
MVYDGKDRVWAVLLDCEGYDKGLISTVQVRGYVGSRSKLNHDHPILCLTDIRILRTQTWDFPIIYPQGGGCFQLPQGRTAGGNVADFLTNVAPYLSSKALAGALATNDAAAAATTTRTAINTKLQVVSDF